MERTAQAAMDRESGASPFGGFRASPDERLARSPVSPSLARAGRWLALFSAFGLHAIVVSLVILENFWGAASAPQVQEIPVEIVVETPQPKPPEARPSPEPSLRTQSLDEEPARDAPRAANDEKVERKAPDEKTKAPTRQNTAKAPGEETAPDQPAPPARQSEAHAAPQPRQPAPDKAVDSADGAVAPNSESPNAEPPRAATPAPPAKVATFVGQPLPTWSKGGPFSTFDPLPDIELGSAAEATTITGGKAKKTYLTVLYGMIMSHVRYAGHGDAQGELVFTVDGAGRLVQRQIARPSGSRELDAAALSAIAEAAPFPPPPQGLPVRLRFSYGSN